MKGIDIKTRLEIKVLKENQKSIAFEMLISVDWSDGRVSICKSTNLCTKKL